MYSCFGQLGQLGYLRVMDMQDRVLLVVTTVDSVEKAEELASALVIKGLVSCAQVSAPVKSFYKWNGGLCCDQEYQIWIKLVASRFEEFKDWLLDNHPYDVPQIVGLDVSFGHKPYLDWVATQSMGK